MFPLVQGYAVAGEFSFGARLMSSIKGNLLFYGVCAAVLIVFVIFYLWNAGFSAGCVSQPRRSYHRVPATQHLVTHVYARACVWHCIGQRNQRPDEHSHCRRLSVRSAADHRSTRPWFGRSTSAYVAQCQQTSASKATPGAGLSLSLSLSESLY